MVEKPIILTADARAWTSRKKGREDTEDLHVYMLLSDDNRYHKWWDAFERKRPYDVTSSLQAVRREVFGEQLQFLYERREIFPSQINAMIQDIRHNDNGLVRGAIIISTKSLSAGEVLMEVRRNEVPQPRKQSNEYTFF